jgi:hypothetical protein
MKVTSGCTASNGKHVEVELDDADGLLQWPEQWASMNLGQRYRALTKIADILVVQHLQADDLISDEYAFARLHAIAER